MQDAGLTTAREKHKFKAWGKCMRRKQSKLSQQVARTLGRRHQGLTKKTIKCQGGQRDQSRQRMPAHKDREKTNILRKSRHRNAGQGEAASQKAVSQLRNEKSLRQQRDTLTCVRKMSGTVGHQPGGGLRKDGSNTNAQINLKHVKMITMQVQIKWQIFGVNVDFLISSCQLCRLINGSVQGDVKELTTPSNSAKQNSCEFAV